MFSPVFLQKIQMKEITMFLKSKSQSFPQIFYYCIHPIPLGKE